VASALVAGCGGSDSSEPSDEDPLATPSKGQLVLHFDDDPTTSITNSGTGDFDIDVVTQDGGAVEPGETAAGDTGGLRTPAFEDSPESPKAILKVTNAGDTDELNPGTDDFTIGADINVDPASESDVAANGDNGNNVMQRGLFEGSQYKLQIDHEAASCRVKGAEGELTVKSSVEIEDSHWYRLRCTRSGDEVTFAVTDMEADNPELSEDESSGPTGSLDPLDASLPLSIGGKLNAEGGIVEESTDQFNGLIDNVVLDIS
jgi:hypothetical protein